VRDETKKTRVNKLGIAKETVEDAGVLDKRLLVTESEFSRTLMAAAREGNTISPILRQAWDGGKLRIMTKTASACSTGAHIGIAAHITIDELQRQLTQTEAANGFANRFLWVYVERCRCLPFGGSVTDEDLHFVVVKLQSIMRIQKSGPIGFDTEAAEAWAAVYEELSAGRPGLLGAILGRAEAQVVRLSLVYALLDGADAIGLPHLRAALAVWDYCAESARYIFGSAIGDDTADSILRYLRAAGKVGATRTAISDFFGRNKTSSEIGRALDVLLNNGHIRVERKETGGRDAEVFYAEKTHV
jgi:hypothetical protein